MTSKRKNSKKIIIFKLNDLFEKYLSAFTEANIELETIPNRTRFKEDLLHRGKGLQSFKCGRDVIILFEDDVGPAIVQATQESTKETEESHIKCAAKIIRQDVVQHSNSPFDGTFDEKCFTDTVPKSLLSFVSTVLRGNDNQLYQAASTISQLIQFNSVGIDCERKNYSKTYGATKSKLVTYISKSLSLKARINKKAISSSSSTLSQKKN